MFENSLTEGHETSLEVNSPAALSALSEKKKTLKCDPWATELLSDSEFAGFWRTGETTRCLSSDNLTANATIVF